MRIFPELKLKKSHPETVDLKNKGEEITVTRFSVNSKGDVTNVNKLPKKLVQEWQKG